jgi:hypothetical protein
MDVVEMTLIIVMVMPLVGPVASTWHVVEVGVHEDRMIDSVSYQVVVGLYSQEEEEDDQQTMMFVDTMMESLHDEDDEVSQAVVDQQHEEEVDDEDVHELLHHNYPPVPRHMIQESPEFQC